MQVKWPFKCLKNVLKPYLSVVLIGKNKEDLEENQNFLDLFKTYPATLKNNTGNGLVNDGLT